MQWSRRSIVAALAALVAPTARADSRDFAAAAFRMKDAAIRAGDQPYGAVVVRDGRIVGWGPSRVIAKRDDNAHAEREAIADAQRRLSTADLSGAAIYATSRPCQLCERAAARAKIARMFVGPDAADAGAPRSS